MNPYAPYVIGTSIETKSDVNGTLLVIMMNSWVKWAVLMTDCVVVTGGDVAIPAVVVVVLVVDVVSVVVDDTVVVVVVVTVAGLI